MGWSPHPPPGDLCIHAAPTICHNMSHDGGVPSLFLKIQNRSYRHGNAIASPVVMKRKWHTQKLHHEICAEGAEEKWCPVT